MSVGTQMMEKVTYNKICRVLSKMFTVENENFGF